MQARRNYPTSNCILTSRTYCHFLHNFLAIIFYNERLYNQPHTIRVSLLSNAFEATCWLSTILGNWEMVRLTKLKTTLSKVKSHHFPLHWSKNWFLCLGHCCSPPALEKSCLALFLAFVVVAIIYITVIVYFLFQWKEIPSIYSSYLTNRLS